MDFELKNTICKKVAFFIYWSFFKILCISNRYKFLCALKAEGLSFGPGNFVN